MYVGRKDSYPEVVRDLFNASVLSGMSPNTQVIGVADGGIGLKEALEHQFPNMQFILVLHYDFNFCVTIYGQTVQ
jgi:hypothetical protein